MSDVNQGTPSSGEQTIPKSRLDELIVQRNQQAQELAFLKGQLSVAQRQVTPQRPERESPEMEQLKQENPGEYNRQKKRDLEMRQLRAGFTTVVDQNDRLSFLMEHGADAKKRLGDVEQILEGERTRGNFNANRAGIYQWLLGQERLRVDAEKVNTPPPPAQASTPAVDAPSSDPKFAQTLGGGSAPSLSGSETREERIAKLKHEQF